MKTRVHINISVRDLAASVSFYETMFGTLATKRRDDYANFRLDSPAIHLALVQANPNHPPATANPELMHFGIELFDDSELATWRERVSPLQPRDEQEVTCCYAVANKFWLADPDGHSWEFWVRHAEANQLARQLAPGHAPGQAPVGCCAGPSSVLQAADVATVESGKGSGCCGGSAC